MDLEFRCVKCGRTPNAVIIRHHRFEQWHIIIHCHGKEVELKFTAKELIDGKLPLVCEVFGDE